MKISTKTWCQLPRTLSKGILAAVVSLCLCGMPTMVNATQTQSSVEQTPAKVVLKGKVVDEAGKPILGASVVVKNTTIGVATNRNGEFSLSVPNQKMILVISSLTYETVELNIANPAGEKALNIMLKAEELEADEPSVIIARRPCVMIKKAVIKPPYRIDPDKCKKCKMCMKIGCPAVSIVNGKARVDATQCVGCGVCEQLCKFGALKEV